MSAASDCFEEMAEAEHSVLPGKVLRPMVGSTKLWCRCGCGECFSLDAHTVRKRNRKGHPIACKKCWNPWTR